MKSEVPKVLHRVFDKTMVDYVIEASYEAGASEVCVVVGHQSAMVKAVIKDKYDNVSFAVQKEQLGTGHAVMQAKDFIQSGNILVLCGDTPLIKGETIKAICDVHESQGNDATVVSMIADNPTGYGRIIRNGDAFAKIVEQKDANDEEKAVKEVNTGVYIFKAEALNKAFESLTNNNAQGEYYLTDTLEIIKNNSGKVGVMTAEDSDEFLGVNSKLQLAQAMKIMKKRINEYHMINGVTITDPENTYIGKEDVRHALLTAKDSLAQISVRLSPSSEPCKLKKCDTHAPPSPAVSRTKPAAPMVVSSRASLPEALTIPPWPYILSKRRRTAPAGRAYRPAGRCCRSPRGRRCAPGAGGGRRWPRRATSRRAHIRLRPWRRACGCGSGRRY